jgi:RimJ/RimL family protein N-acetyltransferase
VIPGARVLLRPVEEDDYPLIHRWQNDPEVWWRMDYERPYSLADVADGERAALDDGHPFIVQVGGRPVGRIALGGFRRRDRICSLSLFIGDPAARGHGYGAEAAATLAGFAFDRMDLRRIEVRTLAVNDAALHAFESCGFVRDAQLRDRSFKDGRYVDHVILSLTREGFDATRASLRERFGVSPFI